MFLFPPWRQWFKTKQIRKKISGSHCLFHQQITLISSLRARSLLLLPGAQWNSPRFLHAIMFSRYSCLFCLSSFSISLYLFLPHKNAQPVSVEQEPCRILLLGFSAQIFFPFVEKQQVIWNFMWTRKSTFGGWWWGWGRDGGWERNTAISALSIDAVTAAKFNK